MTRSTLPEGVPADNQGKTGAKEAGIAPPDMAVPRFAGQAHTHEDRAAEAMRGSVVRASEYEDDLEDNGERTRGRMPVPVRQLSIMLAAAALIGALGAILFIVNRSDAPLCSTLPEWNQYNCRMG